MSGCVCGYVRCGLLLETVLGVCFIISGLTFVKSEWAHNYWGKIVEIICYRFFRYWTSATAIVSERTCAGALTWIQIHWVFMCSSVFSNLFNHVAKLQSKLTYGAMHAVMPCLWFENVFRFAKQQRPNRLSETKASKRRTVEQERQIERDEERERVKEKERNQ